MPASFRRSPALLALVPAVVLALAAVTAPQSPRKPDAPKGPDAPTVTAGAVSDWDAIERLVNEQKLEEASRAVTVRLSAARAGGDEDEWTRALIRQVQLRSALHGYETSVRFLKDEAWPQGNLHRMVLQLFYARTLVDYAHAYSWEIRQRERVESATVVDLKAWTMDQIAEEALRAYDDVWQHREALGALPSGRLSAYLQSGNYPETVRGTLRDVASYLLVELLADSSLWRPEQASGVFRLDLPALLAGDPQLPSLTDASQHPLAKIAAVLGDLEGWHASAGRQEAQLEARLERVRRLRSSFTEPEDQARIRAYLEQGLRAFRAVPWWAVGMAELGGIVRSDDAPDALVAARRIAEEGRQAYPDSIGGKQCLTIVRSIEAPDFQLASMMLDAARKRSVRVTHRNLEALHFRAWRRDIVRTIESARDYDLLGDHRDAEKTTARTPDAEWSVTLPATPDYRSHVTYVTPPLDQPGLYTIRASARRDFGSSENRILATSLIVSDLVLVTRQRPAGVEVAVTRGATGSPVPGADIALYRLDWQKGHKRLATKQADAAGTALFETSVSGCGYVVLGSLGEQVALDPNQMCLNPSSPEGERSASLVYTDRSVYRPQQKISWKVVAYRGGGPSARYQVMPSSSVTVTLVDPNNQVVDSRTVTTNTFGSASAEFTVPTGRVLGQWWVRSNLGGQAAVRVEEYKRPTFEVTLDEPTVALRLNRPALLVGTARYYFGLPVTAGGVRWRVVREPVWPWWWGHWFWEGGGPAPTTSQTVATGSAALDAEGRFRIEFSPQADERKPREVTYRYSVTADITDDGGETRSATRAYRLGFVSVEAMVQTDTAFLREGEEAEIIVRRTDLDGAPRTGEGSWRLLALQQPERTLAPADQPLATRPGPTRARGGETSQRPEEGSVAYKTQGDGMRPRWAHGYAPEAVLASWPDGALRQDGKLKHAANGEATLRLRGLAPGAYRLRYETKDEFGAAFALAKDLVVAGRERTRLQLPALLLAERSSVRVGETARLLAVSGFPGGQLVVDIEKNGRRVTRHVLTSGDHQTAGGSRTSGSDQTLIEIPITEADRGGFGVTLTAVLDHQLVTLTQQVFVPWDDRELKLSFATFRDLMRPGARESWRVNVRSADGTSPEAGAAELLAYMYDRSLDVFSPHNPAKRARPLPHTDRNLMGESQPRPGPGSASGGERLCLCASGAVSRRHRLEARRPLRDRRHGAKARWGLPDGGAGSDAGRAGAEVRAGQRVTPARSSSPAHSAKSPRASPASRSRRQRPCSSLHPSRCAASSPRPPSGSRTC